MAFFGKVWKQDKSENFDAFTTAIGVPDEYKQKILSYSPKTKIEKNGDTFTYTTTYDGKQRTVTFKSGETFEEDIAPGIAVRSTVTVDGDVITHVQEIPTGKIVRQRREFQGEKVTVTLTVDGWDGEAYIYLSAD